MPIECPPALQSQGELKSGRLQSGKKRTAQRFTCGGPETARWVGGLPREGVVAEKFAPSLDSSSSLGFEGRYLGCPAIFAGMSRISGGLQKFLQKKKFVCTVRSLKVPESA